ncbi:MAG TPA: hypothetical protein VEK84_03890 [Terriglobales bacterium]|nr:hypothetical protein [Terriglobales bacterium]
MIQPLRAVHRGAFVTLAVVLPAILLIGLGARRLRRGPGVRAADLPATAYVVRESSNLWQKHTIRSEFDSRSDHPQDIVVILQSAEEFNEPDLLLYWAAVAPEGNSLPKEARLMGAFTKGKVFPLPLKEKRAGYLVLFSPAHQTVFDAARVETLP